MRYRYLLIRSISLFGILTILMAYQLIIKFRMQNEQIVQIQTELNELKSQRLNDGGSQESNNAGTDSAGNEGNYEDGVYTGSADGFGGAIDLTVSIDGGRITSIDIVSADGEDEAYLSMGEEIIPEIISAQSAEVDSITGATYSSDGIKNAVISALAEAQK